jgi:hypothetical protein
VKWSSDETPNSARTIPAHIDNSSVEAISLTLQYDKALYFVETTLV